MNMNDLSVRSISKLYNNLSIKLLKNLTWNLTLLDTYLCVQVHLRCERSEYADDVTETFLTISPVTVLMNTYRIYVIIFQFYLKRYSLKYYN